MSASERHARRLNKALDAKARSAPGAEKYRGTAYIGTWIDGFRHACTGMKPAKGSGPFQTVYLKAYTAGRKACPSGGFTERELLSGARKRK